MTNPGAETSGSENAAVALVMAAGSGERLGGALPKPYRSLAGKPLLRHSVERFLAHPAIARCHVVIAPSAAGRAEAALEGLTLPPLIHGGTTRQESVRLGLEALSDAPPAMVLIHDAARPLLPAQVVDRLLAALETVPGALPCLPVADSLKRLDGNGDLAEDVARDGLWRAQTPQAFRYSEILEAHRRALDAGWEASDDTALLRRLGGRVRGVEGDERLIKVTHESDLQQAEALLALPDLRCGQGFDVHRFGPGDHVTLCGVAIPHDHGLVGHSDADVALHALTDALHGAMGTGDIGHYFPASDPQWRGMDSAHFLEHALGLVGEHGARITNVDVTIICQLPRIGPHREAMTARLAELMRLPAERVNVKATTTEKLGFTGRGEGIAAQAAATLVFPGHRS